ncbi:MAG: AMP-binding protein [Elusimicrobia bacterium]|nr:AMP-binding protein [Elusimicrobiota bacterium]
MEIKNTYIFGEEISKDYWTLGEIKDLTKKAFVKKEKIFSVPKEYIVSCLSKTGKLFSDRKSPYFSQSLKHLSETVSFSRPMTEETLKLIPALLSKNELNKRMNLEMFFPYALDNPMERHGYDGLIRAMPKGVVLHVGAGNVFLGILDSLILGLLTKNVNIVKLSSSGSNFLNIFASALKECDEKKLIFDSFSILNWGGGKKDLEKEIVSGCDCIFVWGGSEAVENYKKLAPINVKVEGFGPKTSFGVLFESQLEREGFEKTAEKIVKDCSMWDQSACSNMHTLYLVGPDKKAEKNALELLKHLKNAFDNFQKKFPQGKLTSDEEAEITKHRQLAVCDKALDKAEFEDSFPNPYWTAIYEKNPSYRISPLNRVLYIKTVGDLDALKKELLPYRGYLQTVGIGGNILEKKTLMNKFFDLNLARFVALGNMLEGKTGSPHDGVFPMMSLVNWVSLEEKPKSEDRLIEIVKLAREKSEFYKKHYAKIPEVLDIETFRKLPFLEKSHVLENTPPESDALMTSKAKRGIYFASGGSTGQPKYVFYDQHEYEHTCRMLAHAYETAGLSENDVIANLFVAGNLWSSWLSVEKAIAYTKAISVPTGSNLPMENIVKYMKDFSVTSLIGLPSFLIKLAEYAENLKEKLPIKMIFYGGEYVGDEMVSFFQKVFPGVSVKSAGYATADAGVIGFQCEKLSKGEHHLFAYSQYVEFIDPDSGKPVKDGEIGELVVTSLNKKHMPIIRYRVGDLGRKILRTCSCGRKEPVFEILGRCDDRIHAGGAHIFVNDIQNAIGLVKGLSFNFRVIIEKPSHKDKISIEAEVKSADYLKNKKEISEKLYSALYEKCEDLKESVKMGWLDKPEIILLAPNSIERIKRTGKIKRVVDKRIKI